MDSVALPLPALASTTSAAFFCFVRKGSGTREPRCHHPGCACPVLGSSAIRKPERTLHFVITLSQRACQQRSLQTWGPSVHHVSITTRHRLGSASTAQNSKSSPERRLA